MGDHIYRVKNTQKKHKAGYSESKDTALSRAKRVSFKSYIQQLEEELLEEELDAEYQKDEDLE